MKFFILTLLVLCVGTAADQDSLVEPASSDFTVETQDYGKSFIYKYFVEPLVSLDEKLEPIIAHCSILGEDLSQKIQTYNGVGSCFFEQMNVFSNEEKPRKNVVFHVNPFFDLLFQWEGLSIQDVFRSYREEDPHGLSGEITLDLMRNKQSASGHLSYLLSETFQPSSLENKNLMETISSVLLKNRVNSLFLNASPYKEGLLKVALSFMNENNVIFYTLEVVTNYYPGADEYFVMSMDYYQEEFDEN